MNYVGKKELHNIPEKLGQIVDAVGLWHRNTELSS